MAKNEALCSVQAVLLGKLMADSTSPTFSIEDVPQLEFTNDNDIPTGSYDTTTSTVSTVTVTGTTTITSNDTENSPFDWKSVV